MKSTMIMPEIPEDTPLFPGLFISCSTGCVVLMTRSGVGTVVDNGDSDHSYLGDFSEEWDMPNFKQFFGKVILEG